MKTEERFVGISVSKAELEVGVLPTEQFWTAPNDEAGRQELAERLRELEPTLVVMEATGGYETPVAINLVAVGLRVAVMNPAQVRDFANAKGQLVKVGYSDARLLALFAQVVRPQVQPLRDQRSRELDTLFGRRRQIVDMLSMEKNRLARTARRVRKSIQAHMAHIVWLEKRLDAADSDLKTVILHRPEELPANNENFSPPAEGGHRPETHRGVGA